MAFKGFISKAKNLVTKKNNSSDSENFIKSMVKTAGTLIATSVMPFLLPILIIGIIVIFVVVSFIQIISTPPIVFGVGNGETSNYCNQDPSKAEYAYEPLEGGLAIPHYRQGDSRWGSKLMWDYDYKQWMTFESVGCAYSAFAMVVSYLLDQKIYPDDVAAKVNASESNDTESWIDGFGPVSDMYDIARPTRTTDWNDMKKAIKNNQPVIAWYSGDSGTFTHTGHFIVVRGMTSDGKYLVNDPSDNTPGYKEKYINRHFTEAEMRKGFGWGVMFNAKICADANVDYLQWAIDIANDDSHGYSQCNRLGPDYDCSSLVWHALLNSGYSREELGNSAFTTYTMDRILTNIGFKRYTYSVDELQPGDILWETGHTGIYAGDGKVVQASSSREGNGLCGRTGDQTGTEIWVSDNQGGWLAYYRRDS